MTPERLEELLAEAVPDGTFGGRRPDPAPRVGLQPTSPEDAARHAAVLDHAVARRSPRRYHHLHPEQPPANAPRSAAA